METNTGKYIDEDGNEHNECYTGIGKYIDSCGIIKYTGTFINGEYFDDNNKLYHPEYGLIAYEGDIKNNKYNGYGIKYDYYKQSNNNIIIDQTRKGIFVDNILVEGKFKQYDYGYFIPIYFCHSL